VGAGADAGLADLSSAGRLLGRVVQGLMITMGVVNQSSK
jgi:hypothetical protein